MKLSSKAGGSTLLPCNGPLLYNFYFSDLSNVRDNLYALVSHKKTLTLKCVDVFKSQIIVSSFSLSLLKTYFIVFNDFDFVFY